MRTPRYTSLILWAKPYLAKISMLKRLLLALILRYSEGRFDQPEYIFQSQKTILARVTSAQLRSNVRPEKCNSSNHCAKKKNDQLSMRECRLLTGARMSRDEVREQLKKVGWEPAVGVSYTYLKEQQKKAVMNHNASICAGPCPQASWKTQDGRNRCAKECNKVCNTCGTVTGDVSTCRELTSSNRRQAELGSARAARIRRGAGREAKRIRVLRTLTGQKLAPLHKSGKQLFMDDNGKGPAPDPG